MRTMSAIWNDYWMCCVLCCTVQNICLAGLVWCGACFAFRIRLDGKIV